MEKVTGSILVVLLLGTLVVAGCANATQAQKGAGIGALLGAGAGAAIGSGSGHAGEGAAIGAALGAGGGYVIGNERDKAATAREMEILREDANTYIVNVRNSNGSETPVTLRRVGSRWVGPKGEYYSTLPTEEQLRSVYGF